MKKLKPTLANNVFLYIDLYALAGTLQMREASLTHQPERNKPPSHAHFTLVCFQFSGRLFAIVFHKSGGRVRPAKFSWKRLISQSFYLLEFLLALFKLLAGLKLQSEILSERNHASIAVSASSEQQPTDSGLGFLVLVLNQRRIAPTRKPFSCNWNLLYSRFCSPGDPL